MFALAEFTGGNDRDVVTRIPAIAGRRRGDQPETRKHSTGTAVLAIARDSIGDLAECVLDEGVGEQEFLEPVTTDRTGIAGLMTTDNATNDALLSQDLVIRID